MRTRSLGFSALATMALTSAASAGTIYVDDSPGGAVYKYTTAGVRSTFSSTIGNTDIGIAFNSSGTLYAAYRDSNEILSYNSAGVASVFADVGSPYGIAVNTAGDVFTGANSGSTIEEFTPAGVESAFATTTDGDFSLAIDSNGDLFLGDQGGNIYEYAPNGTRTTIATGLGDSSNGLTPVNGLTFNAAGDLFAADWGGEIYEFTPTGTKSVFATFSQSTLPTGLVYDYSTGNLYMSEVANGSSQPGQQTIQEFSSAGVQSTFASGLYVPYGIADLQASPTPEPASFLLFGGGLILVSLYGRRRRLSSRT